MPSSFDPGHRRSRVQPLVGGMELVIPSQIGFTTAFLGVWLCGWAVGEVFASREVLGGRAPVFLYVWLLAWTFGGAFALLTFLWALLGRERLLITRDQLVLVYECGPLPTIPLWGSGSGPLTFDYGFRTIDLADGVSPAEARVIASEITEHARLSAAAV